MKFMTTNELERFRFAESYIVSIQKINGYFQFTLDNVTILPENSCNRDVREMRANGLNLKIENGSVESLVEEGYQVYDADGNPKEAYADRLIPPEQYNEALKALSDGTCSIYSLERKGGAYVFALDAEDGRTYLLRIAGMRDIEEWDRFLNK